MPRIKPIHGDNASGQPAATLDAVKAKIGMVPSLLTTLADSDSVLKPILDFPRRLQLPSELRTA